VIKPGDIVYRRYKGGLKNNQPYEKGVGLVIKEIKERSGVTQYYVKFDKDIPKWFYQHNLHRIGGERNEND
tara:strand:+ start:1167 stop:1379 length:213 start_codon:yes stop_codon:yes gene_type:complete